MNPLSYGGAPLTNLYVMQDSFCTYATLMNACFILYTIFFFKKWANLGLFFVYFRSFQTNITIFTTNICEKMSIQYTVPGFEPTTFGT